MQRCLANITFSYSFHNLINIRGIVNNAPPMRATFANYGRVANAKKFRLSIDSERGMRFDDKTENHVRRANTLET